MDIMDECVRDPVANNFYFEDCLTNNLHDEAHTPVDLIMQEC